jgi:hypothetical protein
MLRGVRSIRQAAGARSACLALAASLTLLGACGRGVPSRPDDDEVRNEAAALTPSGPNQWYETSRTPPPEGADAATWGNAVALSGQAALIASRDDGVHAFELVGGTLVHAGSLRLPVVGYSQEYGLSLGLSGDQALVGVPFTADYPNGIVHAFSRSSGWGASGSLVASDSSSSRSFGASVAVSGRLAVVGAPVAQAAYVFEREGERWVEHAKLVPGPFLLEGEIWSGFGSAVAIFDDTVVVGAPGRIASFCGKAFVFDSVDSVESGAVVPPSRQLAKANSLPCRTYGTSVAVSPHGVLVGAPGVGGEIGIVHAYPGPDGKGAEQRIVPRASIPDDAFGASLAVSGDTLVVGAVDAGLEEEGAAYVFEWNGTAWAESQSILGPKDGLDLGERVALDGDTLLLTAVDSTGERSVVVERRLGSPGAACSDYVDCGLGHCVEGVCCDRACDGSCETCADGTCRAVARSEPGSPACARYLCDGKEGDCPSSCRGNADCVASHHCLNELCVPKGGKGDSCAGPEECRSGVCAHEVCVDDARLGDSCEEWTECASGYCVDGVCCESACDAQCAACDADGRCVAVSGAPRATREPCEGAGTVCAGECDGKNAGRCDYPGGGVVCGNRCEDGNEVRSVCSGAGTCVEGDARFCGLFACGDEGTCKTECYGDSDCSGGNACWEDGTCAPSPRCATDATASERSDGEREPCFPYGCGADGRCMTRCTDVRDCALNTVCHPMGHCAPLPAAEKESGCACRGAPGGADPRSSVALFALLVSLYARRTRRRVQRGPG